MIQLTNKTKGNEMSDVVDRAAKEVEEHLQSNINKQLLRGENIQPNGLCHYCEEAIEFPKLFCNGGCADLHHRDPYRRLL